MNTLIIIQIVAQVFMKGIIKSFLSFFFTLQIFVFLTLYEVPVPANADIYMTQTRKLVRFESIKPDNLLQVFFPDKGWTVASLILQS